MSTSEELMGSIVGILNAVWDLAAYELSDPEKELKRRASVIDRGSVSIVNAFQEFMSEVVDFRTPREEH